MCGLAALDAKYQISSGGRTEPLWAPDGRTLYYRRCLPSSDQSSTTSLWAASTYGTVVNPEPSEFTTLILRLPFAVGVQESIGPGVPGVG